MDISRDEVYFNQKNAGPKGNIIFQISKPKMFFFGKSQKAPTQIAQFIWPEPYGDYQSKKLKLPLKF